MPMHATISYTWPGPAYHFTHIDSSALESFIFVHHRWDWLEFISLKGKWGEFYDIHKDIHNLWLQTQKDAKNFSNQGQCTNGFAISKYGSF